MAAHDRKRGEHIQDTAAGCTMECMVAKQGGLAIMTGNTQTQWGAMPCIARSLDFLQDELAAKVPKVLRESSLHACVRVREAEMQEAVTQVAGSHKHCTFVPQDAFKTCKPDVGGSNEGLKHRTSRQTRKTWNQHQPRLLIEQQRGKVRLSLSRFRTRRSSSGAQSVPFPLQSPLQEGRPS